MLTQAVAAPVPAHVVGDGRCRRHLEVLPHLVESDCTYQTVLYGAGEQKGTCVLHQHSHDVVPRAVVWTRDAAGGSVQTGLVHSLRQVPRIMVMICSIQHN